jgi:hypothetical protein
MLFLSVRGFSDYAGPTARSRFSRNSRCCRPPIRRESASWFCVFRSPIARPADTASGTSEFGGAGHPLTLATVFNSYYSWKSSDPYRANDNPGERRTPSMPLVRRPLTASRELSYIAIISFINFGGAESEPAGFLGDGRSNRGDASPADKSQSAGEAFRAAPFPGVHGIVTV